MDEHTRVGLRMGLGIFIITFVGWGLLEPNLSKSFTPATDLC